MSPATKKSLADFATKIHWGALGHPDDVERFLDFIISAYHNNEHNISLDEFLDAVDTHTKKKVVPHDPKFVKKRLNFLLFLFSKYEDGIKLLHKFEEK